MHPNRRATSLATAISLAIVAGCTATGDTGTNDTPSTGASSRETDGDLANRLPHASGDAREAYDRARARLESTPEASTPSALIDAAAPAGAGTLVLYDRTGEWGWLGELYATNIGSLVSHFGTWTAKPAAQYTAGEMGAYAAVVYVGSTFDETLPVALLDDVLVGARPVVWMDHNIWQLAARSSTFAATYGFEPWIFDTSEVAAVDYKGISLTRHAANGAGIMTYSSLTTAKVLAEAVRTADGTKIPWAVRGGNVTYIGENPMAYVSSNDRYLAFADLLFDALAPATPERHRALVRIEDVSGATSASSLRAIADYLSAEKVPFSIATIPRYVDPKGYYNGGVPRTVPLSRAPGVASAIRYMTTKGGTVIMHGYTHQLGTTNNPYNAVSADDFEFYSTHIDAANFVIHDGPVPGDSRAWAADRINRAFLELALAFLPRPTIFEYPHYAGSVADSQAVRGAFSTVYHRGLYFGGALTGAPPNYGRMIGVMYPYKARDVYGFDVIPENLGSYEPEASNNNPPRLVADVLRTARANRVVRDGFASFYFHPYYPLSVLKQLVAGIKAEGYTFVAASAL